MEKEIRYFRLPEPVINELKKNPVARDLYISETGELEIMRDTIWETPGLLENHLLAYCTRGKGIVVISDELFPLSKDQFIIIPEGHNFRYYSELNTDSRFFIAFFNGKKSRLLGKEFSVVRSLIPSVNNLVANREMLFEEIFNNLGKGFHNENLEYVSFCFGHLLATFIYASRNCEDLAEESSAAVRKAIEFMHRNLDRKVTLKEISKEIGYSETYFTVLFKKETGYSPLSYFSHLKILRATEFLDHTHGKVKEISYALGYSDPYYFTRDFKKKMGMSPRQYRNRVGN